MRSAQRRKLAEERKQKGRLYGLFFKVFLPIILIIGLLIIIRSDTKYWNAQDKFILAYRLESGEVAVSVLDPKLDELTTLLVPGDTEVDVARNYGELRIKNVWQLGINEGAGGSLLAETVSQNFLFPVFLWSDSDAKSLADGSLPGILHFIVFPKSTNIALGDRFSAGLFALRVNNSGRGLIDLGKNQFLLKQKLTDGQSGFVLGGPISPRLTVYFSDNYISDANSGGNLKVVIKDTTGVPGVADKVGQIVEVMGGKVVSVEKKNSDSSDCLVLGTDHRVVKKIADLFSCKTGGSRGEMDLEIDLGASFARRF